MYQITETDKAILFRVKQTDSIEKLTMLKETTIDALSAFNITIVEDLFRNDKIIGSRIEGVSDIETDKLRTICNFMLHTA